MDEPPVHQRTVFIVDDDASVRDSLSLLLSLRGYATAVFSSAEAFLGVLSPRWQGCVVADIRMPGISGLAMQQVMAERGVQLPVIIITAHGDIAAARQAFKAAAVDFLEKPFDDDLLLQAIDAALAGLASTPAATPPRGSALSPRERQVYELIVAGLDNRSIAERLGISPRTVEVHKARLMAKLGARNLAELIRISTQSR
ncbi:response regulator transcription factor [Aquabacterium sp.]|uniref:response regulator transcription factor n=1 Tax=Aquabacterium sp. TaxID=1872578 RepID=UPI00378393D5